MNYNLISILGPTAAGKTRLAALLAGSFNGEIISADSRQVYKGMDIGTGKDYSDYLVNNQKINYYLIDIAEPEEEYNLFQFQRDFFSAYKQITAGNKIPFLTGGTGLYVSSIIQNYNLNKADFDNEEINSLKKKSLEELQDILKKNNPKLHNTTDLLSKERVIKAIVVSGSANSPEDKVIINSLNIAVLFEREKIKKRITERLHKRLNEGMIEEVEKLINNGVPAERLINLGLEYRFITLHLTGKLNYNDMLQKLNSSIHKFAKRQMTWLRKIEREGTEIHWIKEGNYEEAKKVITENYFK
jgi:tRNA dimethylallyltransferase